MISLVTLHSCTVTENRFLEKYRTNSRFKYYYLCISLQPKNYKSGYLNEICIYERFFLFVDDMFDFECYYCTLGQLAIFFSFLLIVKIRINSFTFYFLKEKIRSHNFLYLFIPMYVYLY